MSERMSVSSRTVERDIQALTKARIIERRGKDFGGKWIVL